MSRRKKRTKPEEKHKYLPSDIVYSSGWCTDDFRLADKTRQLERDRRKQENALALGEIFALIESENITSPAHLVRFIYQHYPNLNTLLINKWSVLRDYVNSRRFDISCGFVDMPYSEVCKQLKASELHRVELDEKISDLWEIIDNLGQEKNKNRDRILELETRLEEVQNFSNSLVKRNLELQKLLEFEELPTN